MVYTFGGTDDVPAVTWLQESLATLGYAAVATASTGVFDEVTEDALRTFQRDSGLPESGEVDDDTWQAVLGAGPADAAAHAERTDLNHFVLSGFEFNSAELRPEFDAMLDEIATDLVYARFADSVYVVGHTSTSGPDDANQALSEARATAVRDALIQRGVAADRIQAWGDGKNSPRLPEDQGPALVAGNRRVEVWIVETAAPDTPPPAQPDPQPEPQPEPTPTPVQPDGGQPEGGTPPRQRVRDIIDPGVHRDVTDRERDILDRIRDILNQLPDWIADALEFDFDAGDLFIRGIALATLLLLAAGAEVTGGFYVKSLLLELGPLLGELTRLRDVLNELTRGSSPAEPPHDAGVPPPAGVPDGPPDGGTPDADQPAGRRTVYGYQGTDGDAILSILREGRLRPKRDMVWLNIGDYRESYQHGSDTARRAQFVIEVVVTFAEGTVREERKATKGLPQALVLHTDQPLETTVVRMFRRTRRTDVDDDDPDEGRYREDIFDPGAIEAALTQ